MEFLKYDNKSQVDEKVRKLQKSFTTHKSKDIGYRLKQLKILRAAIDKYEKEMDEANKKDLGHSSFTSFLTNTASIIHEIDVTISNFQEWAKPRYQHTPVAFAPGSSYILPEPFGVVLIMGAWNFNFSLALIPLACAISAGNVCILKPSEMAPYSALVIQKMCEELDPDLVQVCQGERETCEALLSNKFDLIFFTGSPMKGKLVAKAAAEFLTPCILELGGQNPSVVDKTASIRNATLNLCSGKFMNSGQVCLSPEYVFVESSMLKPLKEELKKTVVNFFTDNPERSEDYSRVINEWHTERLSKLVKNPGKGAIKLCGGNFSIKEKYIEPSIFEFENFEDMRNSSLAKEEIFGPIMYLVPYTDINDVVDYINSKDKPLAMYYFGNNPKTRDTLLNKTSSGAFLENDAVIHYANEFLPFGGVGASGYGHYHGKWGFDSLSHLKPVMIRNQSVLGMRYPPYANNEGKMRFLMKNLNYTQYGVVKFLLWSVLVILLFVFRNNIIERGRHLFALFSS